MKPYLAIIADSFREALASRILWILLVLITLFLAALSPLGFRAEQTTEFRQGDFLDARGFVAAVHEDFDRGAPSPGHRLWSTFDGPLRQTLGSFQKADENDIQQYYADFPKLLKALNDTLQDRRFYDATAWQDVVLGSDARELIERGLDALPAEDLARLNRLLIITPYDKYFRAQPPKQIRVTYLGWNISPPIRTSEKVIKQVTEQAVLPNVMAVIVGFFGVFAAILVTASIIPQMFDPGSLSLLLSKPVSRSLMFLAKFLGGCAFILINATYFILGLWLIVGLRLGIWSQGLLLCIPIFLFLFAIYYSVSAVAGVIWRNAIVCVVITVLFYMACKATGMTKHILQELAVENKRLVRLVSAGDTLITLDENKATYRWDAESGEWQPVFFEGGGGILDRVLGPIYVPDQHLLLAAHAGDRGLFRANSRLLVGREADGWKQVEGPSLPVGTWELLPDPHGRLLAVTHTGVEQLVGTLEAEPKRLQLFFVEFPQLLTRPFRPAGPSKPLKLAAPMAAAVDPQSGNVVTYSRGELTLLARQDEDYLVAQTASVDTDEDHDALVAYAGSLILLALADGRVMSFEAPSLTWRGTCEPEPGSQPRLACTSPDGKMCAILFHNGRLHVFDAAPGAHAVSRVADVRGQGDISAAAFGADNSLLVADRVNRVTVYDPVSGAPTRTCAPALTPLEIVYYYAILPIYTVFPQPGELANTIQYVLTNEDTFDLAMLGGDLQTKRVPLHPWAPVRSSLIFVVVLLTLACIYIERQDF